MDELIDANVGVVAELQCINFVYNSVNIILYQGQLW